MQIEQKNEILVIGGTGNVGRPLVKLLQHGVASYTVIIRRGKGAFPVPPISEAKTVTASLGDWESIEKALVDKDTVFLLSPASPDLLELHNGLIDRAKEAGVKKIVRMSVFSAKVGSGIPLCDLHAQADNYLEQSGLQYAILRPHYFFQNMESLHVQSIKDSNSFAQYLGNAIIPMVDTRDIANVAFRCLTSDEFNQQTHYITGPRSISFVDVASALSEALGREITYMPLTFEEQEALFIQYGVPAWQADSAIKLFKQWDEAGIQAPRQDYAKIAGVPATDINQYATDFVDLY